MYQPQHLYDLSHVVPDRIHDLETTATELHVPRREAPARAGLLARMRLVIGRRLVSLGGVVAGGHI